MFTLLWLVPVLPFAGFVVLALLGPRLPRFAVALIGVGSVGLSALLALALSVALHAGAARRGMPFSQTLWTWLSVGKFSAGITFYLDPLSVVMMLVITVVGFLIHLYSVGFMAARRATPLFRLHEPVRRLHAHAGAGGQPAAPLSRLGRRRAVQLPAHRLLVQDPANVRAAMKAFIVTRIGDTALAIGLFLLFNAAGHAANAASCMQAAPSSGRRARRWRRRGGAAAGRRGGQIRATAAADLAARCHGRPHAGERADPCRHHGHRRRLPHRAHACALQTGAAGAVAVAVIGAATLLLAALQRAGAERYQAHARLLHHEPDRLYVPGAGRGRLVGRDLPLHDACLLQSAALPGRRGRHPQRARRARHLPHGRLREGAAARLLDLPHRRAARSPSLPLVTAGFYSKDAILCETCTSATGSLWLWAGAWIGAFLTAVYTFRMVSVVLRRKEKTVPTVRQRPVDDHSAGGAGHLFRVRRSHRPAALAGQPALLLALSQSGVARTRTRAWRAGHGAPAARVIRAGLDRWHCGSPICATAGVPSRRRRRARRSTRFCSPASASTGSTINCSCVPSSGSPGWTSTISSTPSTGRSRALSLLYNQLLGALQNGKVRWYAATVAIGVLIVIAILVLV